jgi:hypothetical protein
MAYPAPSGSIAATAAASSSLGKHQRDDNASSSSDAKRTRGAATVQAESAAAAAASSSSTPAASHRPHLFSEVVKNRLRVEALLLCCKCNTLTASLSQGDSNRGIWTGEAAHITAASPGGARYDATLSKEQRSHADNGIWLCLSCHTTVDADPAMYPVEMLRQWKAAAIARNHAPAAAAAAGAAASRADSDSSDDESDELDERTFLASLEKHGRDGVALVQRLKARSDKLCESAMGQRLLLCGLVHAVSTQVRPQDWPELRCIAKLVTKAVKASNGEWEQSKTAPEWHGIWEIFHVIFRDSLVCMYWRERNATIEAEQTKLFELCLRTVATQHCFLRQFYPQLAAMIMAWVRNVAIEFEEPEPRRGIIEMHSRECARGFET